MLFSIHSCSVPNYLPHFQNCHHNKPHIFKTLKILAILPHIFKTLKILAILKTQKYYTNRSVFTDRITFENYHTLLHMHGEPLHYSTGKTWCKLIDINPFIPTHAIAAFGHEHSYCFTLLQWNLCINTVSFWDVMPCTLAWRNPLRYIFWVNTEGGHSRLLQNVSNYLPDYMVSHLRRLLWEHWHVGFLIRRFYSSVSASWRCTTQCHLQNKRRNFWNHKCTMLAIHYT
jgi:hypothetical protein